MKNLNLILELQQFKAPYMNASGTRSMTDTYRLYVQTQENIKGISDLNSLPDNTPISVRDIDGNTIISTTAGLVGKEFIASIESMIHTYVNGQLQGFTMGRKSIQNELFNIIGLEDILDNLS